MELIWRHPLSGRLSNRVQSFLQSVDLRWLEPADSTLIIMEGDEIIATGSRQANVLKYIASSPQREGEGLIATVVTELIKDAFLAGHPHLFLYTKPAHAAKFSSLGFYPITVTPQAALMENRKDGIKKFVEGLGSALHAGVAGAVVANCNPFTNGHLHLITAAARECAVLHLFILSEEQSEFPFDVRMRLVLEGVNHLSNVLVHPTGPYLVSSATFPSYFLKEQDSALDVYCQLDLAVFAEHFAPPLGLSKRFVGSEPLCRTTASYNRQMKNFLPSMGIEVIEFPRLELNGEAVSASRVRKLLHEGNLCGIKPLVPETTYAYLKEMVQGHAK